MSWNPQPTIGNALWSGNAPLVTTAQLVSTVSSLSAAGDNATWSLYPAISDVNLANYNLSSVTTINTQNVLAKSTIQVPYLSTMEVYCSSINGSTITLFGSTITIEGVTITNNTVKAETVQKTRDIFDTINDAATAAGNVVSVVQQAAGGFLSNTGSALQQVLWTTYAVDQVVNLATDVTKLATGIQGLINSRDQNNISGGTVPGQNAPAYETFNGTTQFQFSTLGTATWTVLRTTNQTNPNLSLGSEILTSTLIPAGSKVVRAVSDPIALPILSTQLLSTTNYAQSFGQWAAILGPDYNLVTSTLTADNISSLFAEINSISSARIATSSLTVVGNLLFSTNADNVYDIARTITSTVTAYDSVSTITQKFVNYEMTLTTINQSESFDMGSWIDITPTNTELWSQKQLTYSGATTPGQAPTVDIARATYITGDYFDLKNIASSAIVNVWNPYESGGLLLQVVPGTFYRFTYSGTAWTYVANPTQTTQTNTTSFNIVQRWNNTIISTNNLLTINAGEIIIPGVTDMNIVAVNNLTAVNTYASTLTAQTGIFSTLFASTSYTQINVDIFTSTTTANVNTASISTLTASTLIFQNVTADSISSIRLSTQSMSATTGYISSLTVDDIIFNRNLENFDTVFTSTLQVSTITGLAGAGSLVNLLSPIYQATQTFTQFYGSTMLSNNTSNLDARLPPSMLYSNLIFTTSTTVQAPFINIVEFSPGIKYTFDTSSNIYGTPTFEVIRGISTLFTSTSWLYSQVEFNATTPPLWIAFSTPTMLSANQTIMTLSNATLNDLTLLYANRTSTMLFGRQRQRMVWDGAVIQPTVYAAFADSNYVDTSVIQSGYQNITLSTGTTAVTNNLTIGGTTTWDSNAIRTFIFALSKAETAGVGGLQTVTTATGLITDSLGQVYNSNVWDFTYSIKYTSVNTPYAISQYYGTRSVDASGNWALSATLTTATAATSGITLTVGFSFIVTMTPRAILQSVGDIVNELPPGFISTTTLAFPAPNIFMSSIVGSTITIEAGENIAILANVAPPPFVSTGNIVIAGTNIVGLIGDTVVVGGSTQTTIDAQTGDVNITAASTISLTAPRITAGTAVIGTPSAYGNNFAYFGNNSLPANGGDYALLQEFNGTTFLNAKLYQRLYLRNGNYDIMILDDTQIQAFKPLNMNSNDITNVRTLSALSTQQIAILQTAGSDFVLFNSGDTRMRAVRNAYVEAVGDAFLIAGLNVDIRAPTTQYVTLQQTGVGAQSYFQLTPGGNVVLNARTYFETIAPSGTYFTSPFTEVRGYLTFNTSNNYINNLRHIYGDIGGGGGGLAIDYMYGLFFNGTGRNANLYIDSGNLNMINYNSGINIANYNSNGTGGVTLFSASNFVNVGTGTGYDVNLNGGRYVSVNAAQPGGAFNIYASTINATSLVATNVTIGQDLNITATGSAQLRASYFNFFNDCYFNNRNLHDMQNIYFGFGAYISRNSPGGFSNAFLDIIGAGGDGQLRLINGSAEVALRANSDLGITPTSGYNIVLNGRTTANSNINMNGNNISNVVGIVGSASSNLEIAANGARNLLFSGSNIQATAYGTIDLTSYGNTNINTAFSNAIVINSDGNLTLQAARTGCNISLYSPDVFITGTSNVIINTKFSTWTGSNNFNILASNMGITSSNAFDIVAGGSGVLMDGTFQRKLGTTNIKQPIFQYDVVATSGSSGSIAVTIIPYTISYVAFACMEDPDPARISVERTNLSTITINWAQAGGGSHQIAWNTMGT